MISTPGTDGTAIARLKDGLNASSRRMQLISYRVANATTPGGAPFPEALEGEMTAQEIPADEVDLETEMVALADEQLRYMTSARLLQRVYQQVRISLGRG